MKLDTAGNKIESDFLYPCPKKCGLTCGCEECRLSGNIENFVKEVKQEQIEKIANNHLLQIKYYKDNIEVDNKGRIKKQINKVKCL